MRMRGGFDDDIIELLILSLQGTFRRIGRVVIHRYRRPNGVAGDGCVRLPSYANVKELFASFDPLALVALSIHCVHINDYWVIGMTSTCVFRLHAGHKHRTCCAGPCLCGLAVCHALLVSSIKKIADSTDN